MIRHLAIAVGAVVIFAAGFSTVALRPALGQQPGPDDHQVTICHDVQGNGNTGNGYNIETVDKDSISSNPNGHDSHEGDIIPAFAAGFVVGPPPKSWNAYPGKGDASLIETGCVEVVTTTTTTTTTTTDPEERGLPAVEIACDLAAEVYRLTATWDGLPATVTPNTIPGDRSGSSLVNVEQGGDSQLFIVNTAGTCVQTTTTTTGGDDPPTTTTTTTTEPPTTTTTTDETTTGETTTAPVPTTPGETTPAPPGQEPPTTTTPAPPKNQGPPKKGSPPKSPTAAPEQPPVCPVGKPATGRCAVQGNG